MFSFLKVRVLFFIDVNLVTLIKHIMVQSKPKCKDPLRVQPSKSLVKQSFNIMRYIHRVKRRLYYKIKLKNKYKSPLDVMKVHGRYEANCPKTGWNLTSGTNNVTHKTTNNGTEHRLCAACSEPITDKYLLQVSGRSWHAHCLRCCVCQLALDRQPSCFIKDDSVYCKSDYAKRNQTLIRLLHKPRELSTCVAMATVARAGL
ncbi:hypothetical protein ANN_01220 [Periplaneta americana]|uniref:LIM zinc-binding domain-containing protein n=1 Tax=Periplaneta americana TaxID=6978 RepID=A0ABQ8TSZ1_PERAM|nr:hypothetical protein ANN_01220 [Periplaneta americana]